MTQESPKNNNPLINIASDLPGSAYVKSINPNIRQNTFVNQQLNKLILDKTDSGYFVFDPDQSNLYNVSEMHANLLQAIQSGENIEEKFITELIDQFSIQKSEFVVQKKTAEQHWGIALHLNHACNLACEYCYADGRTSDMEGNDKGTYGGPVTYMRPDIMEAALIKAMENAPGEKIVVIVWGGEPLLSEKRFLEAVNCINAKAVEYKKIISYQITTNGTKFTRNIINCLKENKFSVVVSMDGGEDTQNSQRPMHDSKSSYNLVKNGIDALKQAGVKYALRGTAIRGTNTYKADFYDLAKLTTSSVTIQFHTYGKDATIAMKSSEERQLFSMYKEIAKKILNGDEIASKNDTVRETLKSILSKSKKKYQCGAGRWYIAVGCDGDVYPCHRFVGMTSYKMGNVKDNDFAFKSTGLFENNCVEQREYRQNDDKNCANCYAKNVCGGGCAQIGASNTGTVSELPSFYCQEMRLQVKAVLHALMESMDTNRKKENTN